MRAEMSGMIGELIDVLGEIAQFTGEAPLAVLGKVVDGTRLLADEWNRASPGSPEEVQAYYRESRCQIYTMAGYNYLNRSRWLLSRRIAARCTGRVLDFGAGIGDNLMRLGARGLRDLTHVDFPGYTRRFAARRYAARDLGVTLAEPDGLAGQWDSVICLDVVEHAVDPAAVLAALARHLAPGGTLFLSVHFDRTGDHPMHFDRPAGFDEIAWLAAHGVERARIVTARALLLDARDAVAEPLSLGEIGQLEQAVPGSANLLLPWGDWAGWLRRTVLAAGALEKNGVAHG